MSNTGNTPARLPPPLPAKHRSRTTAGFVDPAVEKNVLPVPVKSRQTRAGSNPSIRFRKFPPRAKNTTISFPGVPELPVKVFCGPGDHLVLNMRSNMLAEEVLVEVARQRATVSEDYVLVCVSATGEERVLADSSRPLQEMHLDATESTLWFKHKDLVNPPPLPSFHVPLDFPDSPGKQPALTQPVQPQVPALPPQLPATPAVLPPPLQHSSPSLPPMPAMPPALPPAMPTMLPPSTTVETVPPPVPTQRPGFTPASPQLPPSLNFEANQSATSVETKSNAAAVLEMACGLCTKQLVRPVVGPCGHVICEDCLVSSRGVGVCPDCPRVTEFNQYRPVYLLNQILFQSKHPRDSSVDREDRWRKEYIAHYRYRHFVEDNGWDVGKRGGHARLGAHSARLRSLTTLWTRADEVEKHINNSIREATSDGEFKVFFTQDELYPEATPSKVKEKKHEFASKIHSLVCFKLKENQYSLDTLDRDPDTNKAFSSFDPHNKRYVVKW
eukprot:CAMPEP_0175094920 /NCGR_PEP_ID=MMETSP0086_2-20121207/3864_1 /TAXON_ID=136419 /ORGANISM="Unknown Unknown, Strain D1" /LENGTH=498 /DNA_ID=CAMNT_0016368103 /DNA_START=63 /DNA_END=1556 /DNA_ORIENTATION=-